MTTVVNLSFNLTDSPFLRRPTNLTCVRKSEVRKTITKGKWRRER